MTDDDWPKRWPVQEIHTNPPGPPYFRGNFKLQVCPTDFKIVRDALPFYFRIKNPTQETVNFEVTTHGVVSVVGDNCGVLKPMQISEPIGLNIIEDKTWSSDDDVCIGYGKVWAIKEGVDSWRELCIEASFHPRVYFDPPKKRFEKKKFEEFRPIEIGKTRKAENKTEPVEAEKAGEKNKKCAIM